MIHSDDHLISEELAWARWWALPWVSAHEDWRCVNPYAVLDSLYRNAVRLTPPIVEIPSRLPPAPIPTVLGLVLASSEQLDLILLLIQRTFNALPEVALSEDHQLWCMRLSKALPPDMLLPNDDPLQLLRDWVEPTLWQRIRLRFPYKRVLETEKKPRLPERGHNRLETLWQAVVWRATVMTIDNTHSDSTEQGG